MKSIDRRKMVAYTEFMDENSRFLEKKKIKEQIAK